jgi:DNA-damage-inducible protein J
MKHAGTRVEDAEYDLFQRTAASIGTTPSDALRIFIYSFNDYHGFPYPVRSRRMEVEPFQTEEDATRFATELAMEALK